MSLTGMAAISPSNRPLAQNRCGKAGANERIHDAQAKPAGHNKRRCTVRQREIARHEAG